MAEDYTPTSKDPEVLDSATESAIKEAEAEYIRNNEQNPIPEAASEGITVKDYFGCYSEFYVVALRNHYALYPEVPVDERREFKGVRFHFQDRAYLSVFKL